jgi:hypothetical protein
MTNLAQEIKFQNEGELAIVRVLGNGRIEVERDGKATKFQPHHTVEDVTEKFEKSGWAKVEAPKPVEVTSEIQNAVDLYLKLDEEEKAIKKRKEEMKALIKPFMDGSGIEAIKGTQGKQVYLQPANASNSTSLYSNYEPADVLPLLPKEFYNDVIEGRVNSEKLEALLKLDKLPGHVADAVKACKIIKAGTAQFRVKK